MQTCVPYVLKCRPVYHMCMETMQFCVPVLVFFFLCLCWMILILIKIVNVRIFVCSNLWSCLELAFLETSALTGENVEEVFLKCTRTILTKIDAGKSGDEDHIVGSLVWVGVSLRWVSLVSFHNPNPWGGCLWCHFITLTPEVGVTVSFHNPNPWGGVIA